jgi:hypothetical protein
LRGIEPSFLLHPLDFLGGDLEKRLDFFPAMKMLTQQKLDLFEGFMGELGRHFELVDMQTHASALLRAGNLSIKEAA